MECFICGTRSTEIDPSGDYRQIVCPGCSEYKIARTAIQEIESHCLRFDVERARDWLNSFFGSGHIPMIDRGKALRLAKH